MSSGPRCVFDSNVIVSAALYEQGNPGQSFYWALEHGEILLSDGVACEANEVLSREEFRRYLTDDEKEQFLQRLIREARLVDVTQVIQACRDPKDDKFLELAVSGNADYLVTGDRDLLVLDPFRGIRIVTPREFVQTVVAQRAR